VVRDKILQSVFTEARVKNRCAVALVVVVVCVLRSDGQQPQRPEPPPAFRVQVDAVEIDAFATDVQGNPVNDLTADDFQVLEDGRRQTITSFAHIDIPVERADRPFNAPTIEADVQHNDGPEGRLYVIAFDAVQPLQALRTRIFLRRFIEEHFGDNDRAAVVSLGSSRAADGQDFTNNRRLLLSAIDRFVGGPVEVPEIPRPDLADTQGNPPPPPLVGVNMEAIARTRIAMSAFRQLTEFMATINGRRKAMLLISTGIPIDLFSVVDNYAAVMPVNGEQAREGVRAAMRGNIAIYTIDPRGLTVEGGSSEATAAPTANERQTSRDERESLRALAEVTGGFALTNSNSFDAAFERIVRENSSYYVLGFQSTNERRDGRYRRLRVSVNRPGVQVRTRDGYLALTNQSRRPERRRLVAAVSPAVSEALASPIGVAAVPMRIFTAPYKGEGPNAAVAVAVEIDATAIQLPQENGMFNGQLEVVNAATAANGRLFPGDRHYIKLALRPETYDQVQQNGLRVLLQPQLAPGRYQLRVAAGFPGRAGSVVADLEVPDFGRRPLMMSGVSLTSAAAGRVFTVRVAEPLAGKIPGPLVATREFDAGDTITMYTEFYENLRGAAVHTIDIKVELRSKEGRAVSSTAVERSSTELAGRAGGGFLAQVPLTDLEPGLYLLHVEARANVGERPTVSRDVQIRVR
jgi:VWFA-related protein